MSEEIVPLELCPVCRNVGVVADEKGDQRICQVKNCTGAARVHKEAADFMALLDAIDNYRAALLSVAPNNKVVINRSRNFMFAEADKFRKR